MNEGFQYFEQHWTSRFDMELLKILQCKALKGQGFEEKLGGKTFFKVTLWRPFVFLDPAPKSQKMLSQIILLKFILVVPSYLSCKLGGFDFLVGLIRGRCSWNVQDMGQFQT